MSTPPSTPPLSRNPSHIDLGDFRPSEPGSDAKTSTTVADNSGPAQPRDAQGAPPIPVMRQGRNAPERLANASPDSAKSRPRLERTVPKLNLKSGKSQPASSTTANQASASSSATGTSKIGVAHDKANFDGAQIPEDLANVLRAGFQGWAQVPKKTDPRLMESVPLFNVSPKAIARLLVGIESNFYKERLNGLNVKEPLRNKFIIKNFKSSESNNILEINVIEHILMPFVLKEFNNERSEAARQAMKEEFKKFATGQHQSLLFGNETTKTKKASAVLEDLNFQKQFKPVVQPFMDLLIGEDGNFTSSKLPDGFKKYIEQIDFYYTEWTAADMAKSALESPSQSASSNMTGGNATAPRYLDAKKNALVGAMLTRGLLVAWQHKFMDESREPGAAETPIGKHYKLLMNRLGHYASFKLDALLIDIMSRHDTLTPDDLKGRLESLAAGAKLKLAEDVATKRKAKNEQRKHERSQTMTVTPRKAGAAEFFEAMLSPGRETEATGVAPLTSPRGASTQEVVGSTGGMLLKQSTTRQETAKLLHRAAVQKYMASLQLPAADLGYMAFLNIAVNSRKNYERFEMAPAEFLLTQLKEYMKSFQAEGQLWPQSIDKIAMRLNELVKEERKTLEKADTVQTASRGWMSAKASASSTVTARMPGIRRMNTVTSTAPASTTAASTTAVSTVPAGTTAATAAAATADSPTIDPALLRSPFEELADNGGSDTSSTTPSSKTESDSTEVETESDSTEVDTESDSAAGDAENKNAGRGDQ